MSGTDTILARFMAQAARQGDRMAFTTRIALGGRADRSWTWREWQDDAMAFAARLRGLGIAPGSHVVILARNTPVWPIADLGTLLAGGTSVGIYPGSGAAQVAAVLRETEAPLAVVDSAAHHDTMCEAIATSGRTMHVVREDEAATGTVIAATPHTLDDWLGRGRANLRERTAIATELVHRAAHQDPARPANVIYTSGSTGAPKGAVLSHRAIAANAAAIAQTLGADDGDSQLSLLPFCHAAERIFGLYTRVTAGMSCTLVPDASAVWEACRLAEPTIFGGLPRLYERLHDAVLAAARGATGVDATRWSTLLEVGRHRAALRADGVPVPETLEQLWREARPVADAVLASHLGTRLRLATSGGAALPVAVAELLDAVGVTVLGAYGQTEHLCVAMQRPGAVDFVSAGPPMPGTTLRIADDGEILVQRGAHTFDGYLHQPDETRAAFTADGAWLHTGDLGAIDVRGRLRVTGRLKELLALSTGRKVAPLPIEARLAGDPWIAQALLVGEGRKYVAALVVPRTETVLAWAASHDVRGDLDALLAHPEVRTQVAAAIESVNATLAPPDRVQRFALVAEPFTVDDGTLTPTLKPRRAEIARRHAALLETLWP